MKARLVLEFGQLAYLFLKINILNANKFSNISLSLLPSQPYHTVKNALSVSYLCTVLIIY